MDINSIKDSIFAIMDSNAAVFLFATLIVVLTVKAKRQKGKKLKQLLSDDRFKEAKIFDKNIKSPIAISSTGCMGISLEHIPAPVIFYIKDIKKLMLTANDNLMIDRNEENTGKILFGGVASKVAPVLQQKLKKLNLIVIDEDETGLNIPLFDSTLKKSIRLTPTQQETIKQLLQEIEAVEKTCKA